MSGDKGDEIEFKWGIARGKGGKTKEVQFYESFTYDGVEYFLYDSVYLYGHGEVEPYIGKLIKIWENRNKIRMVKVLWFFRPSEVSNYLGNGSIMDNELLLATGTGSGLTNVNSLEAISGKCNIVCTSKDERNRQPSLEEREMADFIFYRTFDVEKKKVSDVLGENVAGVDVRLLLNRKDSTELNVPKLDLHAEGAAANVGKSPFSPEVGLENAGVLRSGPNVEASFDNHEEGADVKRKAVTAKDDSSPVHSGKKLNADNRREFLDNRPSKKLKSDGVSKLSNVPRTVDAKASIHDAIEGGIRREIPKDLHTANSGSKELKANVRLDKVSDEKLLKRPVKKVIQAYGQVLEVTRRPEDDRSRWFKDLPWEQKMENAIKERTLVLLQNLDPAYTSSEVQDIIWHGFRERCTAKMVQRTAISSSFYGQSFVVFKTREAAENTVMKLRKECLMLPNRRPLVAKLWAPSFPSKQTTFPGHLLLDKLKLETQRDKRDAVSTSHSSQPNNLEYDLAMEWRLLQDRSDSCWTNLCKRQEMEYETLKAKIRRK